MQIVSDHTDFGRCLILPDIQEALGKTDKNLKSYLRTLQQRLCVEGTLKHSPAQPWTTSGQDEKVLSRCCMPSARPLLCAFNFSLPFPSAVLAVYLHLYLGSLTVSPESSLTLALGHLGFGKGAGTWFSSPDLLLILGCHHILSD